MQPLFPKGQVSFRIIENDDQPFLFRLFCSTRAPEMDALIGWGDGDKQHFLEGQFAAQTQGYATNFIGAVHRIIQLDGVDVGRLIVNRADDHMRIIDLSLVPEARGKGLGTDILRSLLNEAHGGKVPVRLAVTPDNPAARLYVRHGFVARETRGYHVEMEWRPQFAHA
ncbi:MAG: GNAT family N-acetyltransferase [Pseudomonadota bacterium]